MSRIGIFPFLGRGHLNPLAALGRKLAQEGHSVTVFHLLMARPAIKRAGLQFCRIDVNDPPDTVHVPSVKPGQPRWAATRDVVSSQIKRVLREGPKSVEANHIEFMIIDQSDLAAGSVADALGIPFASVGCAPPLFMDPNVPLSYFGWGGSTSIVTKIKTYASNLAVRRVTEPLIKAINVFRRTNKLETLVDLGDTLSKRAVITQIPKFFDLPRRTYPPQLFYTGPFRDAYEDCMVKFPWDRLNGKPIVFASLGTVHNNDPKPFRTMAEACAQLDVQLVISLGGGSLLPETLDGLAGRPIIVEYAPQRELLKKAVLAINCAGLNTTLDAIAAGVPLVAIPIAEDQPGVAARISRAGVGTIVPLRHLATSTLRSAIDTVLGRAEYNNNVKQLATRFNQIDGVAEAVSIFHDAVTPLSASKREELPNESLQPS